jgi:hypothetical protein
MSSIAIGILGVCGRPVLHSNIEIEGLGRVRKDFVGQGIRNLLDQSLRSGVGRPADRSEVDRLAEGQAGRLLNKFGWRGGFDFSVPFAVKDGATSRFLRVELEGLKILG